MSLNTQRNKNKLLMFYLIDSKIFKTHQLPLGEHHLWLRALLADGLEGGERKGGRGSGRIRRRLGSSVGWNQYDVRGEAGDQGANTAG